jgi:acetyl esterase/lipase
VVWGRTSNQVGWTALLGDAVGGDAVPYDAAPARLTDFTGLPPTFIDVGEIEVFRDEDLDYARGLLAADVATEFHLYPGAFHGFDIFVPLAAVSRRANEQRLEALRRAFGR